MGADKVPTNEMGDEEDCVLFYPTQDDMSLEDRLFMLSISPDALDEAPTVVSLRLSGGKAVFGLSLGNPDVINAHLLLYGCVLTSDGERIEGEDLSPKSPLVTLERHAVVSRCVPSALDVYFYFKFLMEGSPAGRSLLTQEMMNTVVKQVRKWEKEGFTTDLRKVQATAPESMKNTAKFVTAKAAELEEQQTGQRRLDFENEDWEYQPPLSYSPKTKH